MLPIFHFKIERWKYNPTFELYVSNMGHFRNKSKADIAPKVNQNGYLTVRVGGSLNKHLLAHRVVMLTWRPTPEAEILTVDHLDHNKRNNVLDNLEWVSREENQRRAKEDCIITEIEEPCIITKTKTKQSAKLSGKGYNPPKLRNNVGAIGIDIIDNATGTIHYIEPNCINFEEEMGKYFGFRSNFTRAGAYEVIKNLLSGKNTAGAKQYCGFLFRVER